MAARPSVCGNRMLLAALVVGAALARAGDAPARASRRLTAGSLEDTLTQSYGTGGIIPCGYATASCTCSYMFLGSMSLTGTVPAELGNCTSMYMLDLGGNALSGSIPQSFSALTGLGYLDLHSNQMSGSVDPLQFLTSLYFLDLHANQFSGDVMTFANLTSLQHMILRDNLFIWSGCGASPAATLIRVCSRLP